MQDDIYLLSDNFLVNRVDPLKFPLNFQSRLDRFGVIRRVELIKLGYSSQSWDSNLGGMGVTFWT